jgi:hypothetical protein
MTSQRWPKSRFWIKVFLVLGVIVIMVLARGAPQQTAGADPSSRAAQPFHSDAKHLWNRIDYRFHVRLANEIADGPDKLTFDPNDHDRTQWTRFPEREDYLLGGACHRDALDLLDEFLAKEGEKLESDPLKRALLQHDLWAMFDRVSSPEWARSGREPYRRERRELYLRLARVIERLALSDKQIDKLPDNYAAAVAAKKYPSKFDPDHKAQAFLPSDLWDSEGPWVLLSEWAINPLATRHVQFFEGRSTFAVLLRLPEGRDQTLKYLKELREAKSKDGGGGVPQLPPQTQVALARRMMLINDSGDMVPTRLTESVQIRVLHDPTSSQDGVQTFLEFRLRRQDLIADQGGGLAAVAGDEKDREEMLFLSFGDHEKRLPILDSCRHCHLGPNGGPGILSVHSYTDAFDGTRRGPRTLTESELKIQESATIHWKRKQYSWGLLTGLKESGLRK